MRATSSPTLLRFWIYFGFCALSFEFDRGKRSKENVLQMKRRYIISAIVGILVFVVFTHGADAASVGREAKKAERFFREGKYDEALISYDRALSANPDDPVIRYNRAVTLYRKGKFGDAEATFLSSLAAGKEELEEKNVYNMGNSRYRIGESMEKSSPEEVLKNYRGAAQFYKRSMEIVPKDVDAKYNYEFVLKKIKELEEKQQKKQPEKKQQKEQQKREEERKNREEERKKREQEEKEKEERKRREEEEKQQQGKRPSGEQGLDDRPADGEMSKEEAEMLLMGQEEEEERMRGEKKRRRRAHRPEVLRNW